jgi:hypothetical protein
MMLCILAHLAEHDPETDCLLSDKALNLNVLLARMVPRHCTKLWHRLWVILSTNPVALLREAHPTASLKMSTHLSGLLFAAMAMWAISRNLIVLDSLAAADDRGVLGDRALGLLDNALGLFDQPLDCVALLSGSFLAD